jgi:glutaredoxin
MKDIYLISSLFILSLFILSAVLAGCTSQPQGLGKFESLAKCLTANNTVMYGTSWCPHCQNQKKAFGASFQYINFVDCDADAAACTDAGIQGYPTWIINGTSYAGEQNIYDLAKNSGCVDALLNATP